MNRVQLGRLITPSPFWAMHRDQDGIVAQFIRDEAHIDMDPIPAEVNGSKLDQMSQFPLLFTNNLAPLGDAGLGAIQREYLKRGGFFYIDGCVNWNITRDFGAFFKAHASLFQTLFPGSRIRMLQEDDPIFRALFRVDEAATRNGGGPRGHWGELPEGLYGIFHGDRMLSLLSLDHLWCGWPNDPVRTANCLRQIANIYVYAMTR